jgi:hypothetical protein
MERASLRLGRRLSQPPLHPPFCAARERGRGGGEYPLAMSLTGTSATSVAATPPTLYCSHYSAPLFRYPPLQFLALFFVAVPAFPTALAPHR